MKKAVAHLLAQITVLGVWTASVTAAEPQWDEDFHTSFMNNIGNYLGYEVVTCVATLGTEVYVGSDGGHIWRYKETDGSWTELATASGVVHALSAAVQGSDKYLFVGGGFNSITFGAQSSDAHNVATLNLTTGTFLNLDPPPCTGLMNQCTHLRGSCGLIMVLQAITSREFDV